MTTAMSKAESNALVVSYDVLGTHVELDLPFVKKYLVRGRAELTSDQELVFFMNTCKMQGLNPLVNGEVYLIKYSKDDPAQMVVGKDAYLRRAFEHPDYLYKQDGIVVLRHPDRGVLPLPRRATAGRMVPGVLRPQRQGAHGLQRGGLQRVQQGSSQLEVQACDHD